MYCYDSGLLKDDEKIIEEKFSNIDYYKAKKEPGTKKIKSIFEEEDERFKNMNYNEINGGIKYKSYEFMKFNLEIYHRTKNFTEELFYAHKNILTNIQLMLSMFKWGKNARGYLIDSIFAILLQSNISNNKFKIDNSSQKDNEFYNIIEIIFTTCLPYIQEIEIQKYIDFKMIGLGVEAGVKSGYV